jgi:fatty-acyl-CoA synthase
MTTDESPSSAERRGSEDTMNGLMMDHYELTLNRLIGRAERLHSAKEIVSRAPDGEVHRTTYGEITSRAHRAAAALADLGVGPGDRVATLLWNQPEHLELYFAATAMGAVIHTLNPRLHADELAFIVSDAADKVIVVDESLLPVLESFAEAQPVEHVIVVSRGGSLPDGAADYEQLIASHEPREWGETREDQAAAMCYTSGTTGRPKGVVYSHRSLTLHSLCAALPDVLGVAGDDTILPVVPMFHANAWGLPFAAAMSGAELVLPGPKLDAVSVLDLLEVERVTMTAGVPTVWMAVLDALDKEPKRWDLSALERMIVGGSAVPGSMIEGFDRHGLTIVQAWGMTETSPLGTVCRAPAAHSEAPSPERTAYRARQGRPAPFVELRARDDDAKEIAWDDESMGELEVRGPWVAAGYHGGIGSDCFTEDGWFRTGDIVAIDEHGCMRICDRSKDVIKSGGEWISSVDLENALMGHPSVAEAAVIAMPDERWGERPLAVVVATEGDEIDADALRDHLSADFAKWQLPERFESVDAIPRTATGKWKKTVLRERFVAVG